MTRGPGAGFDGLRGADMAGARGDGENQQFHVTAILHQNDFSGKGNPQQGVRTMKKLILAMAVGLLPVAAFADYSCTTRVNTALIYADGSVNVVFSVRGDYTYVCNVTTARLGVDPVTCALWAATLLSARKNASNVMLYY